MNAPINGFSNPLGQFSIVKVGMAGADAIPCLSWIDHNTAIAWSRDLNRSAMGTRHSFWVVPAEAALDADLITRIGLVVRF